MDTRMLIRLSASRWRLVSCDVGCVHLLGTGTHAQMLSLWRSLIRNSP
jgi:hypothetical protein